jgi:2-iminoacetate synthase
MIIDNNKIEEVLNKKYEKTSVSEILKKSEKLERLTMAEVAALLSVEDDDLLAQICEAARVLKEKIYGKRLVVFAPLYISNLCNNECLYCAFRASNGDVARKHLSQEEIVKETEALLKTGQKRILLVSGEAYPKDGLDYVLRSIETVYSVKDGKNNIRRLNVNIAPLEVEEFKRLKAADIGTYQLFQETYHKPTYEKIHLAGPKSDYDYRLEAIDRAFQAGFDDVGIGILFGL